MTSLIKGCFIGFSLDDDCFHDSRWSFPDEYFAEQAFGELNNLLPEVIPIKTVFELNIFGSEVPDLHRLQKELLFFFFYARILQSFFFF